MKHKTPEQKIEWLEKRIDHFQRYLETLKRRRLVVLNRQIMGDK